MTEAEDNMLKVRTSWKVGCWTLVGGLLMSCVGASAAAMNPDLKALAAAANKEGTLNLSWSQSTLGGSQGAARFQAAMNKMFGTKIRVNFTPGPAMARIGNQLATEYQAKEPASIDLYLGAAAQVAPLVKLNMFAGADWKKYLPGRIRNDNLEMNNRFVRLITGLSGVTYNSRLAPFKPTTMADFLKPQWKGKIASTPYAAGFDVLSANDVWGKQKTVDYVRKLSHQISGLIRCGDTERLATGEFIALVMDCTGQEAKIWKERGAPLEQMMPRDGAEKRYYYLAVPKNAKNPAAAKLFTVFSQTEEGQRLVDKTWGADLSTYPGSDVGNQIKNYLSQGVKFKEVTIKWWLQHPEIEKNKRELIKILTNKS